MNRAYIPREFYLERIIPYINKDIVKVIVGQRRVGKSYFMFQIMGYLKKGNIKESNIIYINKELHEFDAIKTYVDLVKHVEKQKGKGRNYLFVDEIQEIEDYHKALESLQAKGGYDIYCTGSNAKMLSSEISTKISGRYIEIKIFGLSYREFLTFHKVNSGKDSFMKYIKFGGLPYLVNLELEDTIVYGYLKSIYDSILLKDIVARHNIRNVNFLERLVEFVADNTASIVSAKKISDFLKSQRLSISPSVVLGYLSYLQEAFFIFKAKRFQIQGKKIFEIGEKYYFEDLGLRHTVIGYRQPDINKILENLVYSHMNMLGYKVSVGIIKGKEVDFVCEKRGERIYIQVAYLLGDKNTIEREFGNLLEIRDNYPKLVVSMDEPIGEKYKGIVQYNIIDFLLKFQQGQ